jgi:CDP-diacylglycerol pyrophosphatase
MRVLDAASILVSLLAATSMSAAGRDAIWSTSKLCAFDQRVTGVPLPCVSVDLKRGFEVMKPAPKHLLLVPTARVQGVESHQLLDVNAPNYFEYAWESRAYLDKELRVNLTRDKVGLAINSAQGRTQDQLHIHVGCLRPDVRFALQVYEADTNENWSRLPFYFSGHPFRIMRVYGDTLGSANPFLLVAEGIPGAHADMASQTIVVAGARFRDGRNGFYIFADHTRPKEPATGERLLDYTCSILFSDR